VWKWNDEIYGVAEGLSSNYLPSTATTGFKNHPSHPEGTPEGSLTVLFTWLFTASFSL
jgi:hypothetical protein